MRALSVRKLLWLALALVLGAGCGLGNDYAVTVTWLINGTAPDPDLCRAVGVDRIRFTVLGPGKERALYANCDDQVLLEDDGYYYGGFVSTRSFEYDVRYRYRVEMLDRQGNLVENASYTDSFIVSWGDYLPWVLAPLELFAPAGDLAGVSGEWAIRGRKPSAADCQQLGAVSVAIDFASSTDENFDDAYEIVRGDCAAGTLISDGAVLAGGEYYVRYVLLDKDDKVIDEQPILDQTSRGAVLVVFAVDKRGTLRIDPVNFAP